MEHTFLMDHHFPASVTTTKYTIAYSAATEGPKEVSK